VKEGATLRAALFFACEGTALVTSLSNVQEDVMTQTVGDFIVARLHEWGVRRMFGYPGDGINGVFGAM
jgi:hypothetical protein